MAERTVMHSELVVADLLEGAKHQVMEIAGKLGVGETISDEYSSFTSVPDLARTIRVAESLGAEVTILVTHPDVEQEQS